MSIDTVLNDILTERARQDAKWGGPDHDDGHTTADFVQLIQDYAAWARVMAGMGSDDKARHRLVQVAALAAAAVESIDRRGDLCPNCDSPMPVGCAGLFADEEPCRLHLSRADGSVIGGTNRTTSGAIGQP